VSAQPIAAILPAVLKQAGTRHETLATLQQIWPRLVGRTLAAHTRPVGLRGGRLTVQADRPGDSFLLSYQQTPLLKRIQAATNIPVEALAIRPGGAATGKRAGRKPCRT